MRKLLLVASVLVASVMASPASAQEMLSNGGFETGTLSSWTVTGGPATATGTCPSDGRNWNVSTSGGATGCSSVGNPSGGTYAAYVMNDGVEGTSYVLSQDFLVASGLASANYSFDFSSASTYSGAIRTFTADLFLGSTLLGNLFTYNVPFSDGDVSWTTVSGSTFLLDGLGGQTATLRFTNSIPQTWTGPAGLGLDEVSLAAVPGAVPEPSTWAMMLVGFGGIGFAMRRRKSTAGTTKLA